MPVFAVEYVYNDRADERNEVRPRHREFLRVLLDQGVILASGPIEGGTGALLIVNAADDAAALAHLDPDPFEIGGLIESRSARRWNTVIGPWGHLAD